LIFLLFLIYLLIGQYHTFRRKSIGKAKLFQNTGTYLASVCSIISAAGKRFPRNRTGTSKRISTAAVYTISGLSVELSNNALSSGQSKGYTAAVEIRLEVPVRFLGNLLPAAEMMLHTEAKYVPVF
jgi:hypothetical protein